VGQLPDNFRKIASFAAVHCSEKILSDFGVAVSAEAEMLVVCVAKREENPIDIWVKYPTQEPSRKISPSISIQVCSFIIFLYIGF